MTDYDAIYRRLNQPPVPYSPHWPRHELSDLWPGLQDEFKRTVDAALIAEAQHDTE